MANNIHSSSASTVEQDPSAKKPGGWRAIKYILGNFHFFFFVYMIWFVSGFD